MSSIGYLLRSPLENGDDCHTFNLSNGAVEVLETAPASPPATRWRHQSPANKRSVKSPGWAVSFWYMLHTDSSFPVKNETQKKKEETFIPVLQLFYRVRICEGNPIKMKNPGPIIPLHRIRSEPARRKHIFRTMFAQFISGIDIIYLYGTGV